MENETVIEVPVDRNLLTKRYAERPISFIKENRERPFCLYLPHAMPGSTRSPYSSEAFRGKSANGPWGDCIEEIDWSTGEILDVIKDLGLGEQTLVIWTSDNGAPRRNPPQGSNLPLGGWGYTTMEGGMRVPYVARWPEKIQPDTTCDELSSIANLRKTQRRRGGHRP